MAIINDLISTQQGYCQFDIIKKGEYVSIFGGLINSSSRYTTNQFIPQNLRPKQDIYLGVVGLGDGCTLNRPTAILHSNGSITLEPNSSLMGCIVYSEYSLF